MLKISSLCFLLTFFLFTVSAVETGSECETNDDCNNDDICCVITSTGEGFCNFEICDYDIQVCKYSYMAKPDPEYPIDDLIFIKPGKDIVLGVITMLSSSDNCAVEGHIFDIMVKLSDDTIKFDNARIISDQSGPSSYQQKWEDADKTHILASSEINNGILNFLDPGYFYFTSYNHYIIIADIFYEKETVPENVFIEMNLEKGCAGIDKCNDSGLPVSFRKIQIEPDNSLIISRGPQENQSDIYFRDYLADYDRGENLLQIKAVSNGKEDSIKSITVKIAESNNASEIRRKLSDLSIFQDTDGDGKGDRKIIGTDRIGSDMTYKFDVDIPFKTDETKYFTVQGIIPVSSGEYFKIQVMHVETMLGKNVFGLPVTTSKIGNSYYNDDDLTSNWILGCSAIFL